MFDSDIRARHVRGSLPLPFSCCAVTARVGKLFAMLMALVLFPVPTFAGEQGTPLSTQQITELVSAASKPRQFIERRTDGTVRMNAPLQDIEAVVGADGIQLDSVAKASSAALEWRVAGLGRTSHAQIARVRAGAGVTVQGDTVSVDHVGLIEQFSADGDGIRQDFVLPEKPAGAGSLALDLVVRGAKLEALPKQNGAAIALRMADDRLLHYHALHVTDAGGANVAARMQLADARTLRIVVDDVAARYPLRIDPTFSDANWSALGTTNFNGGIAAVVVGGGNVYVGGFFSSIPGGSANSIAMWNGSMWSALGGGVNGQVRALAWDAANERLYAGGNFNTADGNPASRVAMWNGSAWSALDSGTTNSDVWALAWDAADQHLYVGGNFTVAGGSPAMYMAMWDGGTSTWSTLGSGMGGIVQSLAWDAANRHLYAGGSFTMAGGNPASNVAMWDDNTQTWSALGSGPINGVNNAVIALAWDAVDGHLYAGGYFTVAGGKPANYVALWDGSAWSALGSGGLNGTGSSVYALAWDPASERLYLGGFFVAAGGIPARHVAMWDGGSWWALGNGVDNPGGAGNVYALAWDADKGRLLAAGNFTTVGAGAGSKTTSVGAFSPPQTQAPLTATADPITIAVNGTSTLGANGGSGTGAVSFGVTSGACSIQDDGTTLVGDGAGKCTVTATKAADATYDSATATVDVTVTLRDQTLTFDDPAPTVVVGGQGTVVATSAAPNSGNPIQYSTESADCSVDADTGVVTGIEAGTDNCVIDAIQPGDASYQKGTATLTLSIGQGTPMITTAPSASSITYGQTLADSTLSGGAASVAGTFAFTTPSTKPNAGTQSQSIHFTPTDTTNYTSANASINVTVTKAPTTTTLSTSCMTTFVGVVPPQPFTLTAMVMGTAPTGGATFTDSVAGTLCGGSVALAGGSAVCTTSALAAGAHQIGATYDADANHDGSASTLIVVDVLDATDALFRNGFEAAVEECPIE